MRAATGPRHRAVAAGFGRSDAGLRERRGPAKAAPDGRIHTKV
jgi:hypothetical protein